jgi:putative oxidoreductase
MMKPLYLRFTAALNKPDLAILLLRITYGLLIFHGWHKLHDGLGGIQGMLAGYGIPAFVAYGVIIGEVIAPVMMMLGIFTRLAALSAAATMVVAWLMVGIHHTFALSPVGAWAIEDIVYYFMAAIVIALYGSGRYSVMSNPLYR